MARVTKLDMSKINKSYINVLPHKVPTEERVYMMKEHYYSPYKALDLYDLPAFKVFKVLMYINSVGKERLFFCPIDADRSTYFKQPNYYVQGEYTQYEMDEFIDEITCSFEPVYDNFHNLCLETLNLNKQIREREEKLIALFYDYDDEVISVDIHEKKFSFTNLLLDIVLCMSLAFCIVSMIWQPDVLIGFVCFTAVLVFSRYLYYE